MGCVYKLDFPNGKSYIGFTRKTAAERFKQHIRHTRDSRYRRVTEAFIECNPADIKVTTLLIADDIDYLWMMEIRLIAAFNTLEPNGYNVSLGGAGIGKWSPEMRSRMVESFKRSWERDYDKRSATLGKQIAAMTAARGDRSIEGPRRKKISGTMKVKEIALGSNNNMAILDEERVRDIKRRLPFTSRRELAERNGVSRSLIGLISQGKRWGHVQI